MMPQFASRWNLVKNYKNIAIGLFIFSIGLFKKVVIADTFATWATNGFDKAETLNMLEAWATSLSYTFQIYFDFSGYTDMAIGAALLFNIKLPQNFNSPYKSTSIQDFWRRWHMTLSRFLKEYVYIPLGGNRNSSVKTSTNLLATFLIGGIWHGAAWTFVFWGLLHGIALVINNIWKSIGFKLPVFIAWFITFNFINITWIFFRAKEWSDAVKVLSSMFFGEIIIPDAISNYFQNTFQTGIVFQHIDASSDGIFWLIGAFVIILTMKNTSYFTSHFIANKKTAFIMWFSFIFSFLHFTKVSEFLYFNF
ncbi:MAG: MBOAT family protein [Helicobacteraceae bacterium]|nr:MBOAT family protein [Candidatus Sulfurimonas ponti]